MLRGIDGQADNEERAWVSRQEPRDKEEAQKPVNQLVIELKQGRM